MLRTAGHATMSSRSPVVRALSGVGRGVGGALGERGRQVDRSQREEQRQAELETSRAEAQERAYLDTLSDADLQKDVSFTRANGETLSNPLWLLLTQVYGHNIQHRAEAAEALTMAGRSPGDLDLLIYMRDRGG